MLTKHTDIATAIGSRICHDLISPIGAISNGLELLELSGTPQSPEMTLIAESVRAANAKVRFLRIAFGDAQSGSTTSAAEIIDILNSCYNTPRTVLHWTIETPLERSDLRLLFLLLLCIEKLTPYGCSVTVTRTGTGFSLSVTGETPSPDRFLDFKSHRIHPQDGPPLIQFNLAQAQLDQMNYALKLDQSDDGIILLIIS